MIKKEKIIYCILAILGCASIILIIIGLLDFSETSSDEPDVSEKNDYEKMANDILIGLDIDDFITSIFEFDIETNKNLLDISNEKTYVNLYMQNNEIEKYNIIFNDASLGDMIYIKYSDFIKYSNKIFGVNPGYNYNNISLTFPNLVKNENGKYNLPSEGVGLCNFQTDVNDCYVLIGSGNMTFNGKTEFSNLSINDNVITGNAKKYFDLTDKDVYIDGSFEFQFEKINDKYVAKSLKILNINEQ